MENKCSYEELERRVCILSNYCNISDHLLSRKYGCSRCLCTRWVDISKNNNSKCDRCNAIYCDNFNCSIQCGQCARSHCRRCENDRNKNICNSCITKDHSKIGNNNSENLRKQSRCQYIHTSGIRCTYPIANIRIRNGDKYCIECIQDTKNW
jgi:hypothetical protein